MLPISILSQWRISQGVSKLNAQHGISSISSADGLKLPSSMSNLSKYQKDVNLLVNRTRAWGELLDMAEGLPDAFSSGMELKDRAINVILNPLNLDSYRLLVSSGAKFGSAAMDLVDAKHNQRHNESLREVADRGDPLNPKNRLSNKSVADSGGDGAPPLQDESQVPHVGAGPRPRPETTIGYNRQPVVELDSSDIKEYYQEYMYRVLDSNPKGFSEKYLGIKLNFNQSLRAEIATRSETVEAFYDGERDVIFVPKLRENASLAEKIYHQSLIEHEQIHRILRNNPDSLAKLLEERPDIVAFINKRIPLRGELVAGTNYFTNNQNVLEALISDKSKYPRLEEYIATVAQGLYRQTQGDKSHSTNLIAAAV